ncbi:hypothetical protein CY35_02G111200 [Sphagnum magellanicum]|nr:hypothetical protein CY35_02G111200 [Sphagnum magellanicum]
MAPNTSTIVRQIYTQSQLVGAALMVLQTWRTVSARHEPQKPIRVLANGAGSVTSAPCSPDPGIFQVFDDEIIPATGLLLSLFFQLLMLITGWLRQRASKASAFAWAAYVSADILAFFLLGLLTRTESRTGVYGLWSALLIYHLGGPDNFTAYERADSELWMRHLLSLLQQVATAAYIIAVNTRGWLLIPTLIVFVIGVTRYWERNSALRHSSRTGINKAMSPIYLYMMNLQLRRGRGPHGTDMLEFLLAGGAEWMQKVRSGQDPEHDPNVVTTGEIERELEFSTPDLTDWAIRLTVASASATAYLRRVVSLARAEQFQHVAPMRNLWFDRHLQDKGKWLPYIHMEQNFLYNLLYAKPVDLERHLLSMLLRMFSSFALVAALLITFWRASKETWDGHASFKVTTYIVLAVGSFVEVVYFIRLVFSKGAVVAMLVAQVRTQRRLRAVRSRVGKFFLAADLSINRFVCEKAMRITMCLEDNILTPKILYVPPSSRNFLVGIPLPCAILLWMLMVFPRLFYKLAVICLDQTEINLGPGTDRGWEMLSWTFREDCDIETEFSKIQGSQDEAVAAIFEPLLQITQAKGNRQSEPASVPSAFPVYSKACLHTVISFYNSDWEHVLIIFWLATLKVLRIENYETSDHNSHHSSCLNGSNNSQRDVDANTHVESRLPEDSNDHELDLDPDTAGIELSTVQGDNLNQRNTGSTQSVTTNSEVADRTKTVWQMLYVNRLLTVCPQLLPTQLDVTKELVKRNLAQAEADIKDPSRWLERTRQEVSQLGEAIHLRWRLGNGTEVEGFELRGYLSNRAQFSDCRWASNHLAVLLLKMDAAKRWEVLRTSACWFIACLAQANKVEEHCARLRDGGELLTTLWILSSDLGGGAQY